MDPANSLLTILIKYGNISVTYGGKSMADSLVYKGHPLQRKENIIYYGSFADPYVIMMQILETTKVGDLDVASKVSVQLQLTDSSVRSRDRIVKKTEKDGLYAAIDVAAVWLERALAAK